MILHVLITCASLRLWMRRDTRCGASGLAASLPAVMPVGTRTPRACFGTLLLTSSGMHTMCVGWCRRRLSGACKPHLPLQMAAKQLRQHHWAGQLSLQAVLPLDRPPTSQALLLARYPPTARVALRCARWVLPPVYLQWLLPLSPLQLSLQQHLLQRRGKAAHAPRLAWQLEAPGECSRWTAHHRQHAAPRATAALPPTGQRLVGGLHMQPLGMGPFTVLLR